MNTDLFLDASVLISLLQKDFFLEKILIEFNKYERLWINGFSYLFAYEKLKKLHENILVIHQQLSFFEIAQIDFDTLDLAKSICKDSDFEDAVQVGSSLQQNISDFITMDKKLASRYKNYLNITLLS